MKLALVVHHARPGGGQDRYVLELARHLSARHEVHLVAVRVEGLPPGTPVQVHALPLRERPVLALAPAFARAAAATLRGHRFDIVHAIGGCLPGASVITAQYCHAAWRSARRRYRVREGSPLREAYQALVGRQAIRFERRAYADRMLRAVIAVSRRTQGEVVRHYGVGIERITVVPNGVEPALLDRAAHPGARAALRRELGLSAATPLALLIGTYARKGLETAVAACARASDAVHLVVAGSGDAAWARQLAAAARLDGRLHLLGPRQDVAALYAAADAFLLPTRYEPFGMVVAEAMAAELPVIVAGCAGAAEWMHDGADGFVVPDADDVAGFAGALRLILADPRRAAEVGRAARRTAAEFAWERVVEQTEAVYRRALGVT